jgi:hypothetical protein
MAWAFTRYSSDYVNEERAAIRARLGVHAHEGGRKGKGRCLAEQRPSLVREAGMWVGRASRLGCRTCTATPSLASRKLHAYLMGNSAVTNVSPMKKAAFPKAASSGRFPACER